MDYRDFIESRPDVMLGKPVIKGTRITIELILKKLSEGATVQQLIAGYPLLNQEAILAAISYASDVISTETLLEVA
jgi:uncharacterized protein (DUF433 family)